MGRALNGRRLDRRALLRTAVGAGVSTAFAPAPLPAAETAFTLLVTNAAGRSVSFIDLPDGRVTPVEVGVAAWGLALAPDGQAYVATGDGVAVVDTAKRARVATVPYAAPVAPGMFGEYRPGGMGIAVSPDGRFVATGVYLPDGLSRVELLDTRLRTVIGSAEVGVRPFDVLFSRDGREIYSIDHDSFTVTVVDRVTLATRTIDVAPLGGAGGNGFEKPHYAALAPNGHLLLPYQGQALVDLDPTAGTFTTMALRANTHQHGVTLSRDGSRLFIVGTGPAGSATGGPDLSVVDLATGEERIYPLDRPHECVALSADESVAWLTGGFTFADGGWDGLTAVELKGGTTREVAVPDRPLAIAVVR